MAKYGRQWSLDTFPNRNHRKPGAHFGRPNSFTASNLCEWNNGKLTSSSNTDEVDAKGSNNAKSKAIFVVREENDKFKCSFKDMNLLSVQEQKLDSLTGNTTADDYDKT